MGVSLLPRRPPDRELFVDAAGRFGDWREPVEVRLPLELSAFVQRTSALRLPFDVAATLAIEGGLVLESASDLAIPSDRVRQLLDNAAGREPVPALGPGRSNRGYVRLLTSGVVSPELDRSSPLMLPVRLHDRVANLDLENVFKPDLLDAAVRWERAAVVEGRFLEDWGLLVLARELAQASKPARA